VILAQVMVGLAHLHTGGGSSSAAGCERRMHRNIKPSNILLNSRGQAKITDLNQVPAWHCCCNPQTRNSQPCTYTYTLTLNPTPAPYTYTVINPYPKPYPYTLPLHPDKPLP